MAIFPCSQAVLNQSLVANQTRNRARTRSVTPDAKNKDENKKLKITPATVQVTVSQICLLLSIRDIIAIMMQSLGL